MASQQLLIETSVLVERVSLVGRVIQLATRGRVILTYRLVQLASCVALLGLSIATLATSWNGHMLIQACLQAYCTLLAIASLCTSRCTSTLSAHLTWVLLLTWAVYAYRDVFPLATTTMQPADAAEGVLLWVKLVLLTLAAVLVPALIPRQPTDSKSGEAISKEQTAGWYSRRVFGWLNETVSRAHEVDHLPLEEYPPLARSDSTGVLVKESLKLLDPLETKADTHVFWGFLRLHKRQYAAGAVLAAMSSLIGVASLLATRGLLASLEAGHRDKSVVQPWAWLVLFFLGPTMDTVCEEWYLWTMNRLSIRNEAIVTELLFQHALRTRVKSETSGDSTSAPPGSEGDHGSRAGPAEKPKGNFLVGRLNNHITSDLANVTEGNKLWLLLLVQTPVRIAVSIGFMYGVLGWSALVGLATLVMMLPVPGYLSGWIQRFQKDMMGRTDARVQTTSEVLNVVRMIKLFGWEARVAKQIDERRAEELRFLAKMRWLEIVNNVINYSIPLVSMATTFATYTIAMKGELTASKLFSSNAAFMLIQQQMHMIFYYIPTLIQARVSLDRINDFLHEPEIIGIRKTSFTWSNDAGTPASAGQESSRNFVLRIDDEVLFRRGRINLVVGPTGSGKTSLLMALLGEMHARPMGPESFVSLPRDGGVAYAAQESWVLSDTIRNNILFGAPYDEVRYAKVIKQCALERDLSLFDAGDKTEVGEKGITLSGGQKARITLARAVYSSAEILLLDDVLAALDVHTGRWIVENCFKGDLVRGRTVILVSHNVALVRPIADFVVALGSEGRIASQGSLDKTLREDQELSAELATEEEQLEKAGQEVDGLASEPGQEDSQKSGKLVVAEEVAGGEVGWDTIRLYASAVSKHTKLYWATYAMMLVLTHSIMSSETYFLGYWAKQYEERDPSQISVPFYLSIYGLIVVTTISVYLVVWLIYVVGSVRASKLIHSRLVSSVLGTTLRWLDVTPTSRIIARCTADIQAIDTVIPRSILSVIEGTVFIIVRIAAASLLAPFFVVPSAIVGWAGAWLGRIYLKAQLCVKREMSNTRAPVLGHFGSAISGLVSIRAYGAQELFKSESYARVDRYSRAALVYNGLNRWVTVRIQAMGSLLSTVLAAYLVYIVRLSSSNAGFAMTMAFGFCSMILDWVRLINTVQVAGDLERVQQYLSIEQEPKPSSSGVPPAYWPASGDLRVEKLSARYSPDGPRVLHELSFEVRSGERIGIVGRTGSGKSSLTLALLRCIFTEGHVYYDGLATDSINLDALRSSITIIPQTPELLSGTLRKNLDPFEQHDDATLNDALRSAGLFSLQENMSAESGGARLTLDSEIAGGGSNLSVGQRQILALARAIVRRSKLLILDEDYDTDSIIQNTLREELGRDVTVLTVAHRLQSIMDADKILVLDAGHIVEYDAPKVLLRKKDGQFRSMVDGSGDKAALYAQAGYSP
ncbi:multidrug resistance-associated ABC transporter [Trametes sanguinea]|nr:multidrug resistance-associated ABC transporter [Trametes sanguinea]